MLSSKTESKTKSKKNFNNIEDEEDQKYFDKLSKLETLVKIENNDQNPIEVVLTKEESTKDPYFEEYFKIRDEIMKKNVNTEITKFIKETTRYRNEKDIFYIFSGSEEYETIDIDIFNNSLNLNNIINNNIKKYQNIQFIYNIKKNISRKIYKTSNEYNKIKYKLFITSLLKSFSFLKENGNLLFTTTFISNDILNFIYLSTLYFEDVYIIRDKVIFLKNFKNNKSKIELLINIIKNNLNFKINNKLKINNLIKNIKNIFDVDLFFKKKLYIYKNKKIYLKYNNNIHFNYLNTLGFTYINKYKDNIKKFYINKYKDDLLKDNSSKLNLVIYKNIYNVIENLIKKYNLNYCLEVGFTYNSLISIFNNIENTKLVSIPSEGYNKEYYNNLVKDLSINKKKFILFEKSIIDAFNILYNKKEEYDLIFINDNISFDSILFNFIYSNKILKKDGYIVINNSHIQSISLCIKYIELNFLNYKKIGLYPSFTILKKINEIDKNPDFFIPFC